MYHLFYQEFDLLTKCTGCLAASLLRETLATQEILFPPVEDDRSRLLLLREISKHGLNPTLRESLSQSSDHENPGDVQQPTDIHSLYKRFPFWAGNLLNLRAEAEDPKPTGYFSKLGDRKKSPRFMYWCGVLALSVAIMFGIVSTMLGALQVGCHIVRGWMIRIYGDVDSKVPFQNKAPKNNKRLLFKLCFTPYYFSISGFLSYSSSHSHPGEPPSVSWTTSASRDKGSSFADTTRRLIVCGLLGAVNAHPAASRLGRETLVAAIDVAV